MVRRPYVSSYFSPDRGSADVVVGFIERTEKTLDIAAFVIAHDEIAEAIIRAHARDVSVRVIADHAQAYGVGSDVERIAAAGVPTKRLSLNSRGLMHNKVAIADRGVSGKFAVITGSFNWSASADERNAENFVIVRLSEVVEQFQTEFDRLWAMEAAVVTAATT